VLPASQTRDKDALTEEGVEKVLKELEHMGFDYVVCDSPAGIERGAVMALTFADEALVVSNPEVSSVRDSDRILGIIQAKSRRALLGGEPVKEHLLITRYSPKRVRTVRCCRTRTCRRSCACRSSASFPNPKRCCNRRTRAHQRSILPDSDVAGAYLDVVGRFLGETIPLRFVDYEKPGLFKRLFGGK
jgi:septum site-determining protein MinD